MRVTAHLTLLLALSACTDLPELEATRNDLAAPEGFPDLLPLSGILAAADRETGEPKEIADLTERTEILGQQQIRSATSSTFSSRLETLRAKAEILREDELDPDGLRDRLNAL